MYTNSGNLRRMKTKAGPGIRFGGDNQSMANQSKFGGKSLASGTSSSKMNSKLLEKQLNLMRKEFESKIKAKQSELEKRLSPD